MRVAARGLRALRHSPRLATLTLAWSVYWAAVTSWWFYAAPLFQSSGASDALLGVVLGGALLVGVGLLVDRRPDRRAGAADGVGRPWPPWRGDRGARGRRRSCPGLVVPVIVLVVDRGRARSSST